MQCGTWVESSAFYVLADLSLADSAAEGCQHLLIYFFDSCLLALPCLFFIFCSSIIPSVCSHFLTTAHYVLVFSFLPLLPAFSLCILFPLFATLVFYCATFVSPFLCQSFWVLRVASCCLSLHRPCVIDVVSRQRPPFPGLVPARLAPLFCWTSWRCQIHQRHNLFFFFTKRFGVTKATISIGLGHLPCG